MPDDLAETLQAMTATHRFNISFDNKLLSIHSIQEFVCVVKMLNIILVGFSTSS